MYYQRIRKEREKLGYTREVFAEKLNVSVSYLAEVERGRTGVSVKLLIKMCEVLGLSADYILFGEERPNDYLILDKIHKIDKRYIPLIETTISELLALNSQSENK